MSSHVYDEQTALCIHCGVPEYAVVDGIASDICGSAPPRPTLNHGGPGVCRLCHPHASAPTPAKPQGELAL